MSQWTPLLLVWLLSALMVLTLQQSNAEPNLANHKLSGLIKWKYEKRPFCNAFTGCGKKRTPTQSRQLPPPPPYSLLKRAETVDFDGTDFNSNLDVNPNNNNNNHRNYYTSASSRNNNNMNFNVNEDMGEGLSDLIDINAEPAVENVQQQIMSQAKIFEAIREASREIFRQRNKQKQLQNQLMLHDQQQDQDGNQVQHQQSPPPSLQMLAKSMESEA